MVLARLRLSNDLGVTHDVDLHRGSTGSQRVQDHTRGDTEVLWPPKGGWGAQTCREGWCTESRRSTPQNLVNLDSAPQRKVPTALVLWLEGVNQLGTLKK